MLFPVRHGPTVPFGALSHPCRGSRGSLSAGFRLVSYSHAVTKISLLVQPASECNGADLDSRAVTAARLARWSWGAVIFPMAAIFPCTSPFTLAALMEQLQPPGRGRRSRGGGGLANTKRVFRSVKCAWVATSEDLGYKGRAN